jgi:hypothetical protein
MVDIPEPGVPGYETGQTKAKMILKWGAPIQPTVTQIKHFEDVILGGTRIHGWDKSNVIPAAHRDTLTEKYKIPAQLFLIESSQEFEKRLKKHFVQHDTQADWGALTVKATPESNYGRIILRKDGRETALNYANRKIIAPARSAMTLMPATKGGEAIRNSVDSVMQFGPEDRIRLELDFDERYRGGWKALFIHAENEVLTCMNSASHDGKIILPTLHAGKLVWPGEEEETLDAGAASDHEQRLYLLLFDPGFDLPDDLIGDFAKTPQGPSVKTNLSKHAARLLDNLAPKNPRFAIHYARYYVSDREFA